MQELLAAKRDLKLRRVLKRLAGYEALILDDLGYVQQSREEMEVLFTLLAERYERGSVLLTSNLPFSGWEAIFKDPMTTAAAIDRLVHHSVIVELNVPSYRAEQAKKAKQGRGGRPKRTDSGRRTGQVAVKEACERRGRRWDFLRHGSGVRWGEEGPGAPVALRGQAGLIGTPSAGLSLGRVASPQSPPPFHPARRR